MIKLRDNEKWVLGWEGKYSVTADGTVYSYLREEAGKELTQNFTTHGYLRVTFSLGGGRPEVHRLVAEAWVDNPTGALTVNHKDGCKTNNAASNLEWLSTQDNTRHYWKGFWDNKIEDIKELLVKPFTDKEIATIVGCQVRLVKAVRLGKFAY